MTPAPGHAPRPRRGPLALALLGLLAVFVVDVVTGKEISISLFYVLPVAVFTRELGRRHGLAASVAAALLWLLADRLAGAVYSQPWIPFWNMVVRLGFFILVTLLLARIEAELAHHAELARTDPLTGLLNARAFYEIAGRELARSRRHGQPLSVAYVDLDDFKMVNDRLGHSAGDDLLCAIGGALRQELRAADVSARLGGDEFGLLLPETSADAARSLLTRLVDHLPPLAAAKGCTVGVSIGAVTFTTPPADVDALVAAADALMYQVKRAGKGAVRHEVREAAAVGATAG